MAVFIDKDWCEKASSLSTGHPYRFHLDIECGASSGTPVPYVDVVFHHATSDGMVYGNVCLNVLPLKSGNPFTLRAEHVVAVEDLT